MLEVRILRVTRGNTPFRILCRLDIMIMSKVELDGTSVNKHCCNALAYSHIPATKDNPKKLVAVKSSRQN